MLRRPSSNARLGKVPHWDTGYKRDTKLLRVVETKGRAEGLPEGLQKAFLKNNTVAQAGGRSGVPD